MNSRQEEKSGAVELSSLKAVEKALRRDSLRGMSDETSSPSDPAPDCPPIRILFVCMGNICRSPAAENVMRHLLEQREISDAFELDSAGTIRIHAGNPPDERMTRAALNRGIE